MPPWIKRNRPTAIIEHDIIRSLNKLAADALKDKKQFKKSFELFQAELKDPRYREILEPLALECWVPDGAVSVSKASSK